MGKIKKEINAVLANTEVADMLRDLAAGFEGRALETPALASVDLNDVHKIRLVIRRTAAACQIKLKLKLKSDLESPFNLSGAVVDNGPSEAGHGETSISPDAPDTPGPPDAYGEPKILHNHDAHDDPDSDDSDDLDDPDDEDFLDPKQLRHTEKQLQKRVSAAFKVIFHQLNKGRMPSGATVRRFLQDSDRMSHLFQRTDVHCLEFAGACHRFRDAFESSDFKRSRDAFCDIVRVRYGNKT